MSQGRRLMPFLLCAGMALIPLFALGGGGTSRARTTTSIAAGDFVGRQVAGRASRNASARSVDAGPTTGLVLAAAGDPSTPAHSGRRTAVVAAASASSVAAPVGARLLPSLSMAPRPAVGTAAPRPAPPTTEAPAAPRHSQTGAASWYDAPAGTCAHQTLPFGTVVTITNLANGHSVTCRVEDRGPYEGGRIADLAEATFSKLASPASGVIEVRLTW